MWLTARLWPPLDPPVPRSAAESTCPRALRASRVTHKPDICQLALSTPCRHSAQRRQLQQCSGCCRWPPATVFTVPPTLQSFGEVVAQKFESPESRALPTFVSAEAGNATPVTAFRSLELAVPTRYGIPARSKPDVRLAEQREGFAPTLSLLGGAASLLSAPSVPGAALTLHRRRSDLRRYPP